MGRTAAIAAVSGLLLAGMVVVTPGALGTPASAAADPTEPAPRVIRAAERLGVETVELEEMLADDPTLQFDSGGALRYVDPGITGEHLAEHKDERVGTATPGAISEGATSPRTAQAATSLADTFALHSNPGARFTLLLDFDGERVADTEWNLRDLLAPTRQPAWDPAGNGATFSTTELEMVQEVWSWVAEDYAPFDVDVTTEDTGEDVLVRSSKSDNRYGVRLLITPSNAAQSLLCGTCGGISYVNIFDLLNPAYRLAWIFPQSLGDVAKNVADAASHEAGHTLGLSHDGGRLTPYYGGDGAWAPIMGSPYGNPVTQFSSGEYSGATNTEDDLGIITAAVGLRADDAPDAVPTAGTGAALGDGAGLIGTAADRDVYAIGSCRDTVRVTATPAAVGPNLDIALALLDADGRVLASAAPTTSRTSRSLARGLDATVSHTVRTAGDLYVRIEGSGNATYAGSYSDYASLGAYRITVQGSCSPTATPTTDPDEIGSDDPTASALTVRAPRRVTVGSRPVVRVQVERAAGGSAAGSVWITAGRRVVLRTLDDGRASYRLPRLKRRGWLTVEVVYGGDADTRGSTVQRRIRVVRRS